MKLKELAESVDVAFSMYSAIPMPQIEWNEKNMKYMLAFLPLVGVVQAALLLGWTALSGWLAVNGVLFAAVATLIPLLVTGGIHMDGLCDTADALASHQTREKKLEILKDSHTGAFAVIGCCAYLLLTFALWTQPEGAQRWLAAETAAVGAVLSRAISAFAVVSIPCAKNSGLVHAFSSAAQKSRVRAAAVVFLLLCAVLLLWRNPLLGMCVLAGCGLHLIYFYQMIRKQFGGITGDLAGYLVQMTELLILLVSVLYMLVGNIVK